MTYHIGALKRLWGLPYSTHHFIVNYLGGKRSIFDELCRRVVKFHFSCLNSSNSIVSTVCFIALNSVRAFSPHGANMIFLNLSTVLLTVRTHGHKCVGIRSVPSPLRG